LLFKQIGSEWNLLFKAVSMVSALYFIVPHLVY